ILDQHQRQPGLPCLVPRSRGHCRRLRGRSQQGEPPERRTVPLIRTFHRIEEKEESVNMSMERLKRIHNGAPVTGTFSDTEMQRRVTNLRKLMSEKGFDAAVFTRYLNINYYSDFLYTSFGRNYACVVTADSHVTVSAKIDAGQPRRRSFGDNIVYTDWRRDNFQHAVATVLSEAGITRGTLGIEDDDLSLELRNNLAAELPGFDFVDISRPTMSQRMVKSDEEISLIKEGARIADLGGSAVVDAIAEGVPEYEVALAGTQAMVREIA